MIGKVELEQAVAKANEPGDSATEERTRQWFQSLGVDFDAFTEVLRRELTELEGDKIAVRVEAEEEARSQDLVVPEEVMSRGTDTVVYSRGFAVGFFAGQIAAATRRREVAAGVVKRALDAAAEAAADEVRMALRHLLPDLPREKVAKRVQMQALVAARDVFSAVDEGRG